jgi:hypothetical protein
MDAAQNIRNAVNAVTLLRQSTSTNLKIGAAISLVKGIQARRFAATYSDLLLSETYGGPARFFLVELYSEADYSKRDAQFSRIAKALQTFFPSQVVNTAVSMAELHQLTEELDYQMALAISPAMESDALSFDAVNSYIDAWNSVGRSSDRNQQLRVVLNIGSELDRLTRTRGLRTMLKMMRKPAHAAGLSELQHFLEVGFDTFASMNGKSGSTTEFLAKIEQRESQWLRQLFDSDRAECEKVLRTDL